MILTIRFLLRGAGAIYENLPAISSAFVWIRTLIPLKLQEMLRTGQDKPNSPVRFWAWLVFVAQTVAYPGLGAFSAA